MIDFFRNLIRPKYEPLNRIEIIKANLLHNLNYLSSRQKGSEIFPVLKSNAYGHGLKELSQILNVSQVKMVAVDSFPEAQIVYKYFRGRVLFINEMPLNVYRYCQFKRSEFVVYNLETLKHLASFKKKAKIHLFVNTGMNREGIDDLEKFLRAGKSFLEKLEISGLCSHLAEADLNSDYNQKQEDSFIQKLDLLHSYKIFPKYLHLGNSAALFSSKNPQFNAFRSGLAFYGYNPFSPEHPSYQEAENNLKPALRVSTTINSVQKIKTGERVSYANKYQSEKDNIIFTIPFGYFEGLNHQLSNQAKFFLKNKEASFRIAGSVCMNITCLELLGADNFREKPGVLLGEKLILISEDKNSANSMRKLSQQSKTLIYENLIRLNNKINRRII